MTGFFGGSFCGESSSTTITLLEDFRDTVVPLLLEEVLDIGAQVEVTGTEVAFSLGSSSMTITLFEAALREEERWSSRTGFLEIELDVLGTGDGGGDESRIMMGASVEETVEAGGMGGGGRT